MRTPEEYRRLLVRAEAEHQGLVRQRDRLLAEIAEGERSLAVAESAKDAVNAAMIATQEEIKGYIDQTVTLALQTVFGERYAFRVSFEIKRGKAEAFFSILRDGVAFSPDDGVGGGIIDTASFGLRITMRALAENPGDVLLLDEPAKNVSAAHIVAFGELMKKVQEMFGAQMLMTTHRVELAEIADRVFSVELVGDKSKVTMENESGLGGPLPVE